MPKISALPAASAVNLSDATVLPLVDTTTTTVKITVAQLRTQLMTAQLLSSYDGLLFLRTGTTNNGQQGRFDNTTGSIVWGVQGSAGGDIGGASAWDAFIRGKTGLAFSANEGVNLHLRISSAGVATFGGLVTIASTVTSAAGTGSDIVFGATTQTTIGANGAASAITALPLGYLVFYKGTTKCVLPFYNG